MAYRQEGKQIMASKRELLKRIETLENTVQQITEHTTTQRVPDRDNLYRYQAYRLGYGQLPMKEIHQPTLLGEVEAIKEHLGINVEYKQETVKKTPGGIVVTSTKKPKATKAKKASKK